jgi:hypothetical protein
VREGTPSYRRFGGAPLSFVLVPSDHPLRGAVERHVRSVFASTYGARIRSFPGLMVAEAEAGAVTVAAGLRTAAEGFFSEHYFDSPLEDVLGAAEGETVERGAIVEIANLAASRSGRVARLIDGIVALAAARGAEWAVFTITPRLYALLTRLGHPIVVLGAAERAFVPRPDDWGTYYDTAPVVAAMRRPDGLLPFSASSGVARSASGASVVQAIAAHA